jgi:transcriptional regulator with XRE-family HTH domain
LIRGERRKKTDLRLLRQQVRLSLKDVALEIGTTDASISRWELGILDLKLKIDQIDRLLKIYQITFEELVEAWNNTEKLPKQEEFEIRDTSELL